MVILGAQTQEEPYYCHSNITSILLRLTLQATCPADITWSSCQRGLTVDLT